MNGKIMIRLDHIFWQLIQCSFLIHSEDSMAISEEISSEHKKKLYCAGNSPTSYSFIWSMIGGLVSVTIPTLLSSISNNVVEKRCRSSSKYLLLPTQASRHYLPPSFVKGVAKCLNFSQNEYVPDYDIVSFSACWRIGWRL